MPLPLPVLPLWTDAIGPLEACERASALTTSKEVYNGIVYKI
jgi:hypothetical protein